MFDLSGRSIKKQVFTPAQKILLENGGLDDGTYLLKITAEKGTYIQRISVIK
ncbi:MAG: T9SS type A sorting domain-containing protein [Bacteroidia bacterium]